MFVFLILIFWKTGFGTLRSERVTYQSKSSILLPLLYHSAWKDFSCRILISVDNYKEFKDTDFSCRILISVDNYKEFKDTDFSCRILISVDNYKEFKDTDFSCRILISVDNYKEFKDTDFSCRILISVDNYKEFKDTDFSCRILISKKSKVLFYFSQIFLCSIKVFGQQSFCLVNTVLQHHICLKWQTGFNESFLIFKRQTAFNIKYLFLTTNSKVFLM